MKKYVQHTHLTLRVVITAFAMVCLLSLAAIPFSSSAHAATTKSQNVTQQAAGTVHGCPLGYACIYPQNAGWNGDRPSNKYYTYGTHNLYNQFGNHNVINNQTDGAIFQFCYGSNGTRCLVNNSITLLRPGDAGQIDLTPYNSVFLGFSPIEA